jgi:hypothetical protein
VTEARSRHRLVTEGMVVELGTRQWAGVPALTGVLDDGTGRIVLAFTGRQDLPGLAVGTRCRGEATAAPDPHGPLLVLWNPRYELVAETGEELRVPPEW